MTELLHLCRWTRRTCLVTSLLVMVVMMTSQVLPGVDGIDPRQMDHKSLFHSLMASRCSVKCVTNKIKPVCGTDDVTYSSRCELKRAKRCDGLRIKVKHKGKCPGDSGPSKCFTERREASQARSQGNEVLVPTCRPDGSYNEIQCHQSTSYCWCVTRDGRHIPGTSVKAQRPTCKGKRKSSKGGKGRKRKSKRRRRCSSKDRQIFNTALIKVFEEEYLRVNPTPLPNTENADEFGTEKSIVLWKFSELDLNKDGILKFKEIRNFGRMVKQLIQPRACAKRFVRYCDNKKDRKIEKAEWTLCLGVDIKLSFRMFISLNSAGQEKPGAAHHSGAKVPPPLSRIAEEMLPPLIPSKNLPVLSADRSQGDARSDKADRKEVATTCFEEKENAMQYNSQEPDANHFIPACQVNGQWEKAQCHQSAGYCWCVKENTGTPIPGTATFKVTPNCSFENEREMKGCPFEQKRRFLVDLIGDLTEERKEALLAESDQSNIGPGDNLSLRETVARWKLKTLDTNNNGVLDRKEWRPMRRGTLKNRNYPRKCRRNFVRYCDEDNNKRITYDEWIDCLGLRENNFNSLPINPKRKGKNPFVDQLT